MYTSMSTQDILCNKEENNSMKYGKRYDGKEKKYINNNRNVQKKKKKRKNRTRYYYNMVGKVGYGESKTKNKKYILLHKTGIKRPVKTNKKKKE